jgi:hypothetical protein
MAVCCNCPVLVLLIAAIAACSSSGGGGRSSRSGIEGSKRAGWGGRLLSRERQETSPTSCKLGRAHSPCTAYLTGARLSGGADDSENPFASISRCEKDGGGGEEKGEEKGAGAGAGENTRREHQPDTDTKEENPRQGAISTRNEVDSVGRGGGVEGGSLGGTGEGNLRARSDGRPTFRIFGDKYVGKTAGEYAASGGLCECVSV